MNTDLRLEPILANYAIEIRDIMVEIVEDEALRWFKNGEKPYVPGYKSIEMQKYHTWDNKYYKIIYENRIIGVILISHTGKEHARIDRFYILPKYQNIGLGSKVIKLVEELFEDVKIWTLDTMQQSSRNHYFYEKNGYELVEQNSDERYYRKANNNVKNEIQNYLNCEDLSSNNFRQCNISNVDLYSCDMSNSKFFHMSLCKNT